MGDFFLLRSCLLFLPPVPPLEELSPCRGTTGGEPTWGTFFCSDRVSFFYPLFLLWRNCPPAGGLQGVNLHGGLFFAPIVSPFFTPCSSFGGTVPLQGDY